MIKFTFYFSISFLILSIPIKKRQLFYYLDQLTTPYTRPAYKKANLFIRNTLSEKKIFGMTILDAPNDIVPTSISVQGTSPSMIPSLLKDKSSDHKKDSFHIPSLNIKSEVLETEYYSEKELLQLKEMLKKSNI